MTFSYQLYSSRNFGPLADTMSMLKDIGYEAVEGYSGLFETPDDIAKLKYALDVSGLSMPTAHFSLDALENDPASVIAKANTLGVNRIYMPFIMPDDRPTTASGWREFGARVETAGKPIRDANLGFGYHNHDFELIETDGVIPMDAVLEGGPSLEWEIDVAWVVRGNADPGAWIAKYKDRITSVHMKDLAEPGDCLNEDGWADVGHGTMDWAGLSVALQTTPAEYFIMEHDNPSDDKRFAERALRSAKSY